MGFSTVVNAAASALGLRKDFSGRTDKYIDAAINGLQVYDVMGTYFDDHVRDFENERLMRYRKNWQFFRGQQFSNPNADGARKLVINLIKPIVNKSIDWLMNPGWAIQTHKGNEKFAPILEFIWMINRKELLSWECAQFGAVCGDAVLQVTVDEFDRVTGAPLPREKQRILIRNVNPAYYHPVYDPFDPHRMTACLIQFPIRAGDNPLGRQNGANTRPLTLYSQYITPTEIVEFINTTETRRYPNKLGMIPIVHIKNMPLASGYFGNSDIDDIISINEEFNNVAANIGDIIQYHAAPTTLIFGAKAHQLEKGANKVWSNLPVNAKVENLKLDGNLDAANKHLEFLKLAMHELSNTPESSLGKMQQISNTSNAALETQYMPLIEKTRRKHLTYGEGFSRVNFIILSILETYFGMNLVQYAGDPQTMYRTTIQFNSPLADDMKEKLDSLKIKLDNGLESQLGALRELGVKDVQRKALEIVADQRMKLAVEVEKAQTATATRPTNMEVVGLGSLVVGTGIRDAFAEENEQVQAIQVAQQNAEQAIKAAAVPPEPPPVAGAPKPPPKPATAKA